MIFMTVHHDPDKPNGFGGFKADGELFNTFCDPRKDWLQMWQVIGARTVAAGRSVDSLHVQGSSSLDHLATDHPEYEDYDAPYTPEEDAAMRPHTAKWLAERS